MVRPRDAAEVLEALARASERRGSAIARGAGRSYGDAAQNADGVVLDMTALRGLVAPERRGTPPGRAPEDAAEESPCVRVGAGTTLAELMRHLRALQLTLPVVPGTRHVTVGGAIAADVHGKNHHCDGSFARHLASMTLCVPDGRSLTISAEEQSELFHATVGGMGLTGVVVEATLRPVPLPSPFVLTDVDRTDSFEEALAVMALAGEHRYAIAWVDLLADGAAFGRSVVMRSSAFVDASQLPPRSRRIASGVQPLSDQPRLSVPAGLSFSREVLRPSTVRAFNALRWHAVPRRSRGRPVEMAAHLFPLDALGGWNRLYGRGGLLQYQFAVPCGQESVLTRILQRLRERRLPIYLAVLKRLGAGSGGLLSFPLEGWTLALDMPARTGELRAELDRIDELVAAAGGRVYLAKDSRVRSEALAAMYPELERFRALREQVDPHGVLRSDLGRRLGLCRESPR